MRQNVTNLKSRAYLDNTPALKPESAQCVRNKKRSLLFTFVCIHGIYLICLEKFHESALLIKTKKTVRINLDWKWVVLILS